MKKFDQSGMSVVLVLLLIVAIALGGYFTYTAFFQKRPMNENIQTEAPVVKTGGKMEDEFAAIEEPKGAPKEINNEALDELDSLVKDIDSLQEEDLSDL